MVCSTLSQVERLAGLQDLSGAFLLSPLFPGQNSYFGQFASMLASYQACKASSTRASMLTLPFTR
jgi:hypothetical protein